MRALFSHENSEPHQFSPCGQTADTSKNERQDKGKFSENSPPHKRRASSRLKWVKN